MVLEIACFNLESCLIAQQAGAIRIELCSDYQVGGITPSKELIRENCLFKMKFSLQTILFCKEQKCEGVVFGILNENNEVDLERCSKLVSMAKPMQCTFHRAFDECSEPEKALNEISECGFYRILTSGGKGNAIENLSQFKQLIELSKNKITIMPGGGIRSQNILEIIQQTGAKEFHSAAIIDTTVIADEKEIEKMIRLSL